MLDAIDLINPQPFSSDGIQMSPDEYQPVSSESNQSGLTFVRPLPTSRTTQSSEDSSGSHVSGQKIEFASRLFPIRGQEDLGDAPSVAGFELGHFVLEERIGRGGMGAVFRAVDQRLNRVVALKILSPELSNDPDAVQRFQNEARAAAQLDHDNIARVHYTGAEKGLHFIAFEFVNGTNIREFIFQKGRISPANTVNYTLQIAEALRHTSAANVVHRDVKPSNIIVSPTGRAKLVDLGLARHQPADQSQDLTVAGTALGTFDYIAPEQALDARNVDVRSDIYSLGCTMYHMLTGEPPYPKGTMFQKVMNHHGPTPPSAREKNRLVSDQLSRVVQKMMASNPDERYASADALIRDLVQIAENLNLSPTYPEAIVWTTPLFKARNLFWDGSRTWMAVALVLLLLVYLVDRMQPSKPTLLADQQSSEQRTPSLQLRDDVQRLAEKSESSIAPNTSALTQPATTETFTSDTSSEQSLPDAALIPGQFGGVTSGGFSGLGSSQSTSAETERFWNSLKDLEVASVIKRPDPELKIEEPSESAPTMLKSPTEQALGSSRPFVVTQSKSGETEQFSTLAEAVASAEDNSAIEIQMDGLLPTQEASIQLANKRVILRAAENFHPIIRFDLSNELALRPLASTAVVFEIGHGGALEIYDVDIDLLVDPRTTVDEWALVQLAPGAEFEARWSSFTVINPEKIPAAFVLVPASEPSDISNIMPERMSGRPSGIRIRDSICRGEMDGIKQNELHPLDLVIEETAFAISGTLHRIDGSNAVETNMATEQEPSTSLVLNHVTAILGDGFLKATTGNHGTLEAITVDIRNSIISVQRPEQALIAISGHLDAEILKEKIQWQSQSDLSFVESSGPLFTIESSASFVFEPQAVSPRKMGEILQQTPYGELFEFSSQSKELNWNSVASDIFFLNDSKENPSLKSASDGRNAGVDWSRSSLPQTQRTSRKIEVIEDSSAIEF